MPRFARILAVALPLAAPLALRAQSPASVSDLAQILALEDRREFDGDVLRRDAQSADVLVRVWAARAIGRIGDKAGTPIVVGLLSDPDTTVRTEAAFALGQLRDSAAVGELVRRVEAFDAVTTDPANREIVTALAKLGGPDAAQAFEGLLRTHPPTGRTEDQATTQALLEAWRLGRLAPAQRLAAFVRDGQGTWRRNAVYSAGRLRLVGAASALSTDPASFCSALSTKVRLVVVFGASHQFASAFGMIPETSPALACAASIDFARTPVAAARRSPSFEVTLFAWASTAASCTRRASTCFAIAN